MMPFPSADSEIIILNQWDGGNVAFARREGTLASGAKRKPRYTLESKSEPLLMDLDGMNLGQGVAATWLKRIQDQWHGIAVVVSPATQAMRVTAGEAFQRGKAWALKRYAGGRIGPKLPNQTNKFGLDSLRTVDGLAMRANPTDGSYTINAPANRFNPETFGPGFDAYISKIRALVPILNAENAIGDKEIEASIKQGLGDMVTKAESNDAAGLARAQAKLRAAKMRVLKQAAKLLAQAF